MFYIALEDNYKRIIQILNQFPSGHSSLDNQNLVFYSLNLSKFSCYFYND